MERKLTFAQKVSRLGARLRDREWRRYGGLLLAGKAAAIAILLLVAMFTNPGLLGMNTFAADPALNESVRVHASEGLDRLGAKS